MASAATISRFMIRACSRLLYVGLCYFTLRYIMLCCRGDMTHVMLCTLKLMLTFSFHMVMNMVSWVKVLCLLEPSIHLHETQIFSLLIPQPGASHTAVDGFALKSLESLVCLFQLVKGTMCACVSCRGVVTKRQYFGWH